MTDDIATPPSTPPPPPPPPPEVLPTPERPKTRISDVIFGWKSAVVIFIGGLILGGLAGVGIGSMGHHHPRGERMNYMRGGPGGYGYGGFQGGGGYVGPGGSGGVPPGIPTPNTSTAPAPSASPKVSG